MGSRTPSIHFVVLTGGPCGGKSTALAHIASRLTKLGFRVYSLPEIATIGITAGLDFSSMTAEQFVAAELEVMRMQLGMENAFRRIAESHPAEHTVVLCDRGASDLRAYVADHVWRLITEEVGVTTEDVKDRRYDCVLHLTTAAIGAEEFYTLANNAARRETPEQARELDERVKKAWLGHDQHTIIDNSTGFDEKIRRAVRAMCRRLGVIEPGTVDRQLLLTPRGASSTTSSASSPSSWFSRGSKGKGAELATMANVTRHWPADVHYEDFDVVVSLLNTADTPTTPIETDDASVVVPGKEERIKRRIQGHSATYTYTESTLARAALADGQMVAVDLKAKQAAMGVASKSLTAREYFSLHRSRLKDVPEVHRRERVFVWHERLYTLQETFVPAVAPGDVRGGWGDSDGGSGRSDATAETTVHLILKAEDVSGGNGGSTGSSDSSARSNDSGEAAVVPDFLKALFDARDVTGNLEFVPFGRIARSAVRQTL